MDHDSTYPQIPGFTVVREIARGAMGIVYEARQDTLDRTVALKVISGPMSQDMLDRFRIEAKALAALHNPNVVQVFDHGHFGGTPYIVLEYCPGGTLTDLVRAKKMSPKEAAGLVEKLASGVAAVHDCDILHRDLKPGNILFDSGGTPKISDFGIAKQIGVDMTRDGAVVGTPGYASPEQARESSSITAATDIYGLGAILYRILGGQKPCRGRDAADTLRWTIEEEPTSLRRLVGGLPRDLVSICEKCLEKEPARRYPSARDLARDLDKFVRGLPTIARPVTTVTRFSRWVKRNRALAAAYGAAIAALIAFAVTADRSAARDRALLLEAQRRLALQSLDHGVSLCEEGEIRRGLLRIALSYSMAADGMSELRRIALHNLSDWGRRLPTQVAVLRHPTYASAQGIRPVAFRRDGTCIAVAEGASVRLSDHLGMPLATPALQGEPAVHELEFSPDGEFLVGRIGAESDRGPQHLRSWRVDSGAVVGPDIPLARGLADWRPVPGGRLVTETHHSEWKATVWDMASGSLALPTSGLRAEASPDGRRIALLIGDGPVSEARRVELWDPLARRRIGEPLDHDSAVAAMLFDPSSGSLLVGCRGERTQAQSGGGKLYRWDAGTGRLVGEPRDLPKPVLSLRPGPSASTVVVETRVTTPGTVGVYRIDGLTRIGSPLSLFRNLMHVCFSQDGGFVFLVDGSPHTVMSRSGGANPWGRTTGQLWRARGEKIGEALHHPWGAIVSSSFCADDTLLVTVGQESVCFWNPHTGERLGETVGFRNRVLAASFGPPGYFRVTLDDRTLVWTLPERLESSRSFPDGEKRPRDEEFLSVGPDRRIAMKAAEPPHPVWRRHEGYGKEVRLWDVDRGRPIGEPLTHESTVYCAAFSPDGRIVATGSGAEIVNLGYSTASQPYGEVRLWDVATGLPIGQPLRHSGPVRAISFSPDGQSVLVRCENHARYWSVEMGRPLGGEFQAWDFREWGQEASFVAPHTPLPDDADYIALWVAVTTRMTLSDRDALARIPDTDWADRRRRLDELAESLGGR